MMVTPTMTLMSTVFKTNEMMMMLQPKGKDDDTHDDPFERFLAISQRQPFCKAVKEFRDLVQTENFGRMSTPSAEDAERRVEALRSNFTTRVVMEEPQLFQAWSVLTLDEQDAFLCRLFLPRALGGLFLDGGGAPGEHQRMKNSDVHDEEGSNQDSENNAFFPEEDDLGEISSLEAD
jgi:hypothetical protein